MKSTLLIVIFIFILGGLGFGSWYIFSASKSSEFTLYKEDGTVLYKNSEDSEYETLTEEEVTLKSGSYVKTDALSYARVYLPDNSIISIDENSEIQVNVDKNSTDINQLLGKTWNRVQELSSDEEYKVETPNTIAAVRGTIFAVSIDDEQDTSVLVQENMVQVDRFELENGKKKILETTYVNANGRTIVRHNADVFQFLNGDIPDDVLNSFWFRRNKAMDEAFLQLKNNDSDNFRTDFRELLETRDDFLDLKLGSLSGNSQKLALSAEQLQKELEIISDFTMIDSDVCAKDKGGALDKAILVSEQYRAQILNADNVTSLLKSLKDDCSDNTLSDEELRSLKAILKPNEIVK